MKTTSKFRGLDLILKEWLYGVGIFIENTKDAYGNERQNYWLVIVRDIADFEMVQVAKESAGQFTGFADKNSKEIFDGDITQNGLVGFVEGVWCLDASCFLLCDWLDGLEIIGNAFENPGLLEKEVL